MKVSILMLILIILQTLAVTYGQIISKYEAYGIFTFLLLVVISLDVMIYILESKRKRHLERMNRK